MLMSPDLFLAASLIYFRENPENIFFVTVFEGCTKTLKPLISTQKCDIRSNINTNLQKDQIDIISI